MRAPAAKVIYRDAMGAALRRWRARLLRTNEAAHEILEELRDSGCRNRRRNSKQPVREAILYLEKHTHHMRYASARRAGLPIGSGNVEATCKTLVGVRMKRSGSRWKEVTGEHIVRLRALALSDRWTEAMSLLHAK